jgi:hypothetical protein
MLYAGLQGRPVFTEMDWLLLFGHPREKVFAVPLWLRFAALLLAVVAIGFALGRYFLLYGLGWFVGALILAAMGVLLIAPKKPPMDQTAHFASASCLAFCQSFNGQA